eukprot:364265-Chlamydomonas_euryale.AAC.8
MTSRRHRSYLPPGPDRRHYGGASAVAAQRNAIGSLFDPCITASFRALEGYAGSEQADVVRCNGALTMLILAIAVATQSESSLSPTMQSCLLALPESVCRW